MSNQLFFKDTGAKKKKFNVDTVRPIPPIPQTDWVRPSNYPDLSSAKIISVDLETCDPHLKVFGPSVRRDGYIAGIAIGTDDGFRAYYPIRHEVGGIMSPHNMPEKFVLKWLSRELSRKGQKKIGANLMYDLDYLTHAGVKVEGPFLDVLIAEPLIDENQHQYNLERISNKYLGEGKDDSLLHNWAARAYGGKPTRADQAKNYYRCPPELVGPYAISDIDLPLRIWEKQEHIIKQENLEEVFDIETRLVPVLLEMRQRGVGVDIARAMVLGDQWKQEERDLRRELGTYCGMGGLFNEGATDHLELLWKKQGLALHKTPKGNVSFNAAVIDACNDPVVNKVKRIRSLAKATGTYIDGYFSNHTINGRIHCQFNQLRSDDGGTVSGRFSSSNPNLQNIVSRGEFSVLRELFIPKEGFKWWKLDYSSIEPRLCAHYGMGPSADALRALYKQDVKTDFYKVAGAAANIDRTPSKVVALGDMYGQGIDALAMGLNVSVDEAQRIKSLMHKANPFIPQLAEMASKRAKARGYITTLSGRRRRFNDWCPANWNIKKKYENKHGKGSSIRSTAQEILDEFECSAARDSTHKSLNSLLQGGSADLIKRAMVESYEAGVYSDIGVPLLTVHDELDLEADENNPTHVEAIMEVKRHMETAYELKVHPFVDIEMGPNWKKVADYDY